MFLLRQRLFCRPTNADDEEFLERLYASTRDDLNFAAGDAGFTTQIIRMQRLTQTMGFKHHFPHAQHWLVLRDGERVGRFVTDRMHDDLRLVDLAVLPSCRRGGVAKSVLSALQEHAREQGIGMSLAVAKNNVAARTLYLDLGFRIKSADDLIEQMGWLA